MTKEDTIEELVAGYPKTLPTKEEQEALAKKLDKEMRDDDMYKEEPTISLGR